MSGWVYFIQGCRKDSPIKIGYARDPQRRLRSMQTCNPSKLRLLAQARGTRRLEVGLHNCFSPWHVRGEWFRHDAPGMQELIEDIRATGWSPRLGGEEVE